MYDVIIIGSGIIGSFIAHDLSKYDIKVLVLEKDIEICNGVSKANSAIIHSGYDPLPNTLKAKLNVLGNMLYDNICDSLNVRIKKIGSLTIARNDEEIKVLNDLYERAKENGVETYLIDKDEIFDIEPNLSSDVISAILSPSTKIISPWEMVYALLENAVYNQVELMTDCEVLDIKKNHECFEVFTRSDVFKSRYIINASGLYAEHIYKMVNPDSNFMIIPTKGQYYVLDKDLKDYVNHVIYPTPSNKGKGVLVVPTIDGNILLGPTSNIINSLHDTDTTKDDFNFIKQNIEKIMNYVPYKSVIHSFCGIRPKTNQKDFIIEESSIVSNFINVAGIDSPGLSCAPAISKMVENILLKKEKFKIKPNYNIYKQENIRINELSVEKKNELIEKNSMYGNIVCRCEKITEGEVVDSIKGLVGVRTVDGVKRRCRVGMGRCQGGFCQMKIVDILSRELNIKKTDVLLNNNDSNILLEETKIDGGE